MKASDFITHLQQMIEIHGDLPLAVAEFESGSYTCNFIEIGEIEGSYNLGMHDKLFDENDCQKLTVRKVFLID